MPTTCSLNEMEECSGNTSEATLPQVTEIHHCNGTKLNQVPPTGNEKSTIIPCMVFLPKCTARGNMRKDPYWRTFCKVFGLYSSKTSWMWKLKKKRTKKLRNCFIRKETEKTWPLSVINDSEWELFAVKDMVDKSDETWTRFRLVDSKGFVFNSFWWLCYGCVGNVICWRWALKYLRRVWHHVCNLTWDDSGKKGYFKHYCNFSVALNLLKN